MNGIVLLITVYIAPFSENPVRSSETYGRS